MTNLIAMSALRSPLVDPINRHPGAASCPFPVGLPILSPVKLAASFATTTLPDRACNMVAMPPSVVDLLAPPRRPPTVFQVWVSTSCDTLVHNCNFDSPPCFRLSFFLILVTGPQQRSPWYLVFTCRLPRDGSRLSIRRRSRWGRQLFNGQLPQLFGIHMVWLFLTKPPSNYRGLPPTHCCVVRHSYCFSSSLLHYDNCTFLLFFTVFFCSDLSSFNPSILSTINHSNHNLTRSLLPLNVLLIFVHPSFYMASHSHPNPSSEDTFITLHAFFVQMSSVCP
jgi:hypothetical protein